MEQETYGYDTFLSPFTWRYGSQEMRRLWSEGHKRRLWWRDSVCPIPPRARFDNCPGNMLYYSCRPIPFSSRTGNR